MRSIPRRSLLPDERPDAVVLVAEELHDAWEAAFGQHAPKAFRLVDVADVLHQSVRFGDYAETFVVGVFRLRDGRFGVARGDCDTTGWDCQSALYAEAFDTLERAIAFGLGEDDRNELGLARGADGD